MNQIAKIQDKIKGEIETAEKYAEELLGKLLNLRTYPDESCEGDYREFKGKIQFGKDLQQWIKNNIEEV